MKYPNHLVQRIREIDGLISFVIFKIFRLLRNPIFQKIGFLLVANVGWAKYSSCPPVGLRWWARKRPCPPYKKTTKKRILSKSVGKLAQT